MKKSQRTPDTQTLGELLAEAKQLLAKCDQHGLSLIAIDVSSAIEKLEERLRAQGES